MIDSKVISKIGMGQVKHMGHCLTPLSILCFKGAVDYSYSG